MGIIKKSSNINMFRNIKKLWQLLPSKRRRQFALVFLLMLLSAIAEVISLGSLLPFLAVLTAPEKVFSYPLIEHLAGHLNVDNSMQLVFLFTTFFILSAVLAASIRIFLLWISTRVVHATGADLSLDLYRRTLYQPYQVHVARNSSSVIGGIGKVEVAVNIMTQSFMLVSSTVFLITIFLALVLINPAIAFSGILIFGLCYFCVSWISRKSLQRNSTLIAFEKNSVIKIVQEGLGGIRDVLLDGTQSIYCDVYQKSDSPLRRAQGANAFIAQYPRFAIEAIGIVMVALIAYILSLSPGGVSLAIPFLGVLAMGAQKMLPSLQQVYSAWTNISGNQASLKDVVDLLNQPLPNNLLKPRDMSLAFDRLISFRAVSFRYGDGLANVINSIDLEIEKGSRVGFIGATGSGKSTLIDIAMGLLSPTNGGLEIDGNRITELNVRSWQARIAHVPQSIFLSDGTIEENIAFGVPKGDIDRDRVAKAADQAKIADLIMSLPGGYDTYAGERGVRLSGGQRQRIGIARALYKRADVLVFDEATSALDGETEGHVMSSIQSLDSEITILIIAHRLSTLKNCTKIVELSEGTIIRMGSYQDIVLNK